MPYYTTDHISGTDRRSEDVLLPPKRLEYVQRRLFIDSRDASVYAPFDFTVKLDDDVSRGRYKNVESIELKAVTIPKIANEDYCVIDIEEMEDSNIDSSVPTLNNGFAVAYFDNSTLAAGDVKVVDKLFTQRAVFNPPITLDKMKVKIRKHDGSIVSPSDTANSNNVTMLFELSMLQ